MTEVKREKRIMDWSTPEIARKIRAAGRLVEIPSNID